MSTIRIGIIGCGQRVFGLLTQIPGLNKDLRITQLFDPADTSIARYQERYAEAQRRDTWQDIVHDENIDWIMVGSPNDQHAEIIIAAMKAGKHIFCEKPIGINTKECYAIASCYNEIQDTKPIYFILGFTLRYSPHYRKIHEIVSSGKLGKIISLEFNETLDFNHGGYIVSDWRRWEKESGGHLLEKCCHDLDLINWIINSRLSKAASFGSTNYFTSENTQLMQKIPANKNGVPPYYTWIHARNHIERENVFTLDKDIVDNQVACLYYENGVHATFHTNLVSAFPERRIYINGTEGSLRADAISGKIEYRKIGFDTEIHDCSTGLAGGHIGGDEVLGPAIAKLMRNGGEAPTSVAEGITSALTAFAIEEARHKNCVINAQQYWAPLLKTQSLATTAMK